MADVKMMYIEDDLKKVQVKTNLYVQEYGSGGVFHLSKEIIQNSVDELTDPDTNGNELYIRHDVEQDKLLVEDNGRGIPEEDYDITTTCTKLQSGSKFFRTQGGNSSGEFGVGLTVVNALASYFTLTTFRNKYRHKIVFEEGVKVDDITEDIKKGEKKHGTICEFIPNKTYLGNNAELPFNTLIEWVDDMSYQVPDNIKIKVEQFNGLDSTFSKKYKSKPFCEYINKILTGKPLMSPLSISGDETIEEEVIESIIDNKSNVKQKKKKMKKKVHLDVAFTYQDDLVIVYDSFCNYTKTTEGGVHVDSVEEMICRFLQNKTKASMTEKEREKWDITWNDVKEGLKLVINLSTNAQVQFMGNVKNKIQNAELKSPIKKIVQRYLDDLPDNNSSLVQMCKFIKANARARIEANKTRVASKRSNIGSFDEYDITNYVKCNNTGKNQYRELYLVEGEKSAMGPVVNGRKHPEFQAAFGFRGVTKNPYKCSLYEIMQNNEWNNFIKVLRCGIGETFDLSKLYFKKIIILTDADIDGFYISMGICSFFVLYLPEVVEAGMLYKVFPPLYKTDVPGHEFVINKSELVDIFTERVAKKCKVSLPSSGRLTNDELVDLLYDTVNYVDIMNDLSRYFKVSGRLIEIVASTLVESGVIRSEEDFDDIPTALKDQKLVTKLLSRVQEKYPEVRLQKNRLNGPVDGPFKSLEINNRFPVKIAPLIGIYQLYGSSLFVKNKKADEVEMSILEFLTMTDDYMPKKIKRYKGLGESVAKDIGSTTMDPENQMLVRLTMQDCEHAVKTFNKLQSQRTEYKRLRKQMMEEYQVDPDNIDT